MSSKLHPLRTLHLFAGAGGGILGDLLLGHRPICAVEIEPYCQQVLSARQKDGFLPWFPIYNDVQTFDGRPWRGLVDVVSGGFPCQDISAAGKGAGITGERSGMWKHMARIIGEVRPRYVLVENSPVLTSRGLDVVLGDLAAMGYDAEWGVLGAADAGAPHQRDRIWILAADTHQDGCDTNGCWESGSEGAAQCTVEPPCEQRGDLGARSVRSSGPYAGQRRIVDGGTEAGADPITEGLGWREQFSEGGKVERDIREWWRTEPDVGGNVDGLAKKMDCA